MTIAELKYIIADLPDDMEVMAYEDGEITRRGDWDKACRAEVLTLLKTTYGGYHDKNIPNQFTQGEPIQAFCIQ